MDYCKKRNYRKSSYFLTKLNTKQRYVSEID